MEALFDVRRDARKVITLLLACLVANVLFYLLFVHPKVRETSALVAERDSFQSDLEGARRRTEALRAYVGRIDAQEKGLERFYGEILGLKINKMVEVEREVSSICQQFGIDPTEVRYETREVPEARVERFVVALPLKGDYQNLRRFIERVESSEHFLLIDSVSLSGTKDSGDTLDLKLQIATYFDAPWLIEKEKPQKKPVRFGARRAGGRA